MSICGTAPLRDGYLIDDGTMKPLAITFATAKKLSGLGLTTLWGLAKKKRIETVRVNRRTLILFPSLERLLAPEPAEAAAPQRRPGRPRKNTTRQSRHERRCSRHGAIRM